MIYQTLRNKLGAVIVALGAMIAVVALPLLGLTTPAAAAIVNSIDVEGNQRVDDETVVAYIVIQPGRQFGPKEVDDSLKALFDTGLFSDVGIDQRGSVLVVTVVENPVVNRVAFEGNKKFKDDVLEGVVQTRPRGVFTRARIQNDVQRLLELYRRQARFQASVEPKIIQLPENRVNVVYEIVEGPNTGVARINFIGNKAFGDGRLREVIDTRQSGLLGFIRTSDKYDPDRIAADEEKLRRYYRNRGYADFEVVSVVADFDRERNTFFITFTVDEGIRYDFGLIEVDSIIPGIDSDYLRRFVTAREGRVFSINRIEESLENITIELAGSGYAFAQVRPRLNRNYDLQTIDVTFVVDEGPRAFIERIEVRGNTRTRDYVIRREFDIAEGDAYNRVLIDRAERRLNNLRYFESVRIVTEPGNAPDRVIVIVDVVEEPTGELSFGAGLSTAEGIVGDVSLTERNFLGRGYIVRITAGGGEETRAYEFAVTDPYFLGRRISAGFRVFRQEYNQSSTRNYDYETTGGGIAFGLPITNSFTVRLNYTIEQRDVTLDPTDTDCGLASFIDPTNPCLANGEASLAIKQIEGTSIISAISYSLIYDTLDNRQNPRDGLYAEFTQTVAGVGGDVSYLRTTATASYYRELLADYDVVGLVRVEGGHITGFNGQDVDLIDAFQKGGETVRGFKQSGFGPRDANTNDSLGGKIFFAGTAEVQFPFPAIPEELGLRGAIFADAGTLYETDATNIQGIVVLDDLSLRSSVGGSILWESPLGPLRADFAYVITSESYDETQWFRIGGGARF